MQDMRKDINDDTDAYPYGDDYDPNLRACAKIRVEDQQAQELVEELSREYAEFTQKLALHNRDCETVIEDDEEHSHISHGTGLPESPRSAKEQDLELKLPMIERLLKFFGEFYERFMAPGVDENGKFKSLTVRERRKKRFMLEALIMMLRKLLLRRKTLSLSELLDEQIRELREALENEQDPEMRKVLQERLTMLIQLRMQLKNSLSFSLMDKFFMLLLGSSLASAAISSMRHSGIGGLVKSSAATYVQTMARVMDTEGIAFGESKVDIASMQDSVGAVVAGYQTSMDRCIADLLPRGMHIAATHAMAHERVLFAGGHFANIYGHGFGANYVADRLMALVNYVVHNLTNAVVSVAQHAVKTAFNFVGAEPPGIVRSFVERGRTAAMRATHEHSRDGDIFCQNIPAQDFHQRAHISFEQNRGRTDRVENSEAYRANVFGENMGRVGYEVTNISFRYQSMHCEQTVRSQQNMGSGPCNSLTNVVVAQSHIAMEASHQIVR